MFPSLFRVPDRPRPPYLRAALLGLTFSIHPAGVARAAEARPTGTEVVQVRLSEWTVALAPRDLSTGRVVFEITNAGTIPHAFEIEGRGVQKRIPPLSPGASATLALTLKPGRYEAYCPVGEGSHEMLGMRQAFDVGHPKGQPALRGADALAHLDAMLDAPAATDPEVAPRRMRVTGGGPVIQILPGPFPFADSAKALIRQRPPDQMQDLAHKAALGPYSNNVAVIEGGIALLAIERGATGDSVSGTARFTTQDGRRWRLVLDRVQTQDIPFNPRFGGVIMGLYYHGATNVHTPLVPTIQSSLALWAMGHLYENERLVTDDAMVHIMLLSRTRRTRDWALECWDCSAQPIEELQLQITPAPGGEAFDAPGGVLFVNWEKSSGTIDAPDTAPGSTMGNAMEHPGGHAR